MLTYPNIYPLCDLLECVKDWSCKNLISWSKYLVQEQDILEKFRWVSSNDAVSKAL